VTHQTLRHAQLDAERQAQDAKRQRLEAMQSNRTASQGASAAAKAANASLLSAQAAIAAEIAHLKVVSIELKKDVGGGFFGFSAPKAPPTSEDKFKEGYTFLTFKNTGRTEGDLLAVSINYFVGADLPATPTYGRPENIAPPQTISANGGEGRWLDYKRPKPTAEECVTVVNSIFGAYWVYGYFVFLDYMNRRQRVRFCFRLIGGPLLGGYGNFLFASGPDVYLGQEPEPG
jgi:hypothetical protein